MKGWGFFIFSKGPIKTVILITFPSMNKNDIQSFEDVELLVNSFYDQVKKDPTIGPIFNDQVKVNWEEHLPKMYLFWAGILLDQRGYSGNPMMKHIHLSKKVKMKDKEFQVWLELFNQTVFGLFEGPVAEKAVSRARNIADLMKYKINHS